MLLDYSATVRYGQAIGGGDRTRGTARGTCNTCKCSNSIETPSTLRLILSGLWGRPPVSYRRIPRYDPQNGSEPSNGHAICARSNVCAAAHPTVEGGMQDRRPGTFVRIPAPDRKPISSQHQDWRASC